MAFAYTVRAEFDDPDRRAAYLAWLAGGHAAAVVAAGARSAQVVARDDGAVEVRYVFASARDYAAYEAGPAVALRAEGAARFGAPGVRFRRGTGDIVTQIPG
ncbi:hypothetical protein GCM10010124_35880 [Pilimelia terevasa]|uniref:DUF4286 family protein n=1 Tax=Pilimelia terevasa TaxID=53372 RepID=A0A8J3FJG5_9ACTN|nr:DUF4286 domain-containing protein [Pilimelia terevasa]GGK40010.1 hypothetical protein GCM10010124_35880 [Pilimelia terevasa]